LRWWFQENFQKKNGPENKLKTIFLNLITILQSDIEKLSPTNGQCNSMKRNAEYIGNSKRPKRPYTKKSSTKTERHTLQETTAEKDIGVIISSNLKVESPIRKKFKQKKNCWTQQNKVKLIN